MRGLWGAVALFVFSGLAHASELSWQAPVENCDGTTIADNSNYRYVIYWGTEGRGNAGLPDGEQLNVPCGQRPQPVGALEDPEIPKVAINDVEFTYNGGVIDAGTSLNWDLVFSPGEYRMTVYAIDPEGDRSPVSNEVIKTVVGSNAAPIILATEQTVYNVVKQDNRFVLLPVGTVPPGTSCDMNNQVNGRGAVPVSEVVWSAGVTVRPVVVVALCDG